MSKESEEYRLRKLRQFEQENQKPKPPEVLEAEQVVAKYREKQARAKEAIPRLRTQLPEPHLCPECYWIHGNPIKMESIPHDGYQHYDRWRCRTCDFIQDEKIIR